MPKRSNGSAARGSASTWPAPTLVYGEWMRRDDVAGTPARSCGPRSKCSTSMGLDAFAESG